MLGILNLLMKLKLDLSLIAWCHFTQNFWVGCDKCAPECLYCYIEREIRKQVDWEKGDGSKRVPYGKVYLTKTWNDPYKIQRLLEPTNYAVRIFTCSLSDFFHAKVDSKTLWFRSPKNSAGMLPQHQVPYLKCRSDKWRDGAWQVILDTPHQVYLILTKRPELIKSRLPADWGEGYKNVWLGTSVGCLKSLNKLDSLRKIPVHPEAVRFVSCEPLIEDIAPQVDLSGIGWCIVGGESGYSPEYLWDSSMDWRKFDKENILGRRTMKLEWARSIQRMCFRQNVPFFFKQITAAKSEQGADALGKMWREYPPAPGGMVWAVKPENPLVVLQ